VKRDQRTLPDVEEVFALPLSILHTASGIRTVRLNLDIQDPCGIVGQREVQGSIPFVEGAFQCRRCFDKEPNGAFLGNDLENGNQRDSPRIANGNATEFKRQVMPIA
jgi:hypothetical protein